MARVHFDFGAVTLDAELLDAHRRAVAAALPIWSTARTWAKRSIRGADESSTPTDARAVVIQGEIAYWPEGRSVALDSAARRSRGDETRLARPCNVCAKALGDVKPWAR